MLRDEYATQRYKGGPDEDGYGIYDAQGPEKPATPAVCRTAVHAPAYCDGAGEGQGKGEGGVGRIEAVAVFRARFEQHADSVFKHIGVEGGSEPSYALLHEIAYLVRGGERQGDGEHVEQAALPA